MASRIRSSLDPSANQFRQKPVQRAKRFRSQDHKRALNQKDSWKKKRPKQSIHVRQKSLKRTPLKRAGRKTKEWERIRRVLVRRFLKAGLWRCELGYAGCWQTNALGFAHAKKRRNCSEKDLWVVR